ncbi:hypothetical protein L3Q82_008796 [Scortum barcoo]|uniref:Uncharacterized protein n=1 Tax=Scortum barcoo TaxID=214431 RepID=A0ACB8XBD5_9TELE|nr:hypothetical protein L3Q82_008796 [Scortum barcoo]
MERDVPSIFFVHFIVFGTATSGLNIPKVVYINDKKGWWEAQTYCRNEYSGLVTIRNAQEAAKLTLSLIVLVESQYTDFLQCVIIEKGSWKVEDCSHSHPFLCSDERLILVDEKKTWEGALQHCAELQQMDLTLQRQYVLTNLSEATSVVWDTKTMTLNAVTDEMWVRLRFLAGNWLWISKEAVTSFNLPTCPDQNQFCGAMDYSSAQWKLLDCNEKRNFICSIRQ